MKKSNLLLAFIFCGAVLHAQTWKPLGPFGSDHFNLRNSAWGGGTGQIHAFAFAPKADHPGEYIWYCASPWGGLWQSADEGHTWTDLNPGLEQVAGICSAIDIAVDPHKAGTIYVANGRINNANKLDAPGVPGTGVFRSEDGGRTFQHTGMKYNYIDDEHFIRLVANPFSTTTKLFVATTKGLYMSQSSIEKKWTKVLDDDKIFAIEVSPGFASNHTVYASGGNDLYISRKEGNKNSFSPMEPSILDMLPAQVKEKRNINIRVLSRDGKDVIYALVYQDSKNYFLFFDGTKWEMRSSPVNQGVYIPTDDRLRIAVNPGNPDNVYIGHTYVCRTDDGGRTWQLAGRYCQPGTQNDPINIHGDIHAVEHIPGTNDVLIGTDGGVFRYLAADKKTVELNNGLNISQVIGMSAPRAAPRRIMIGTQDTGYDIYDGNEWTNFYGGDGYAIHASATDTTLFMCNESMRFRANTNKPVLERSSCKSNEKALFANVAFDPKDPDRCFVAGTNISYTGDGGKTLAMIYKYHTAVGQPVDFETQIECIAASHLDATGETIVYATNYGFTNGSVCKMVRGHISAPSSVAKPCDDRLCSTCWTKVPLPQEKMEWLDATAYSITGIAVSADDPDELWVCYSHSPLDKDELTILHSTDGGGDWSDMNKGLPAYTNCSAIVYDEQTHFLYLGTQAGIYINRNDGIGWELFGAGLPRAFVKALEIQPGIRKIRAGLYGRGVWETDMAEK